MVFFLFFKERWCDDSHRVSFVPSQDINWELLVPACAKLLAEMY